MTMNVDENTVERKINLLTEEVYNRIAAGEVVERPASVLKELIENALDADAGEISISVEAAGQREITVSDDGFGMNKADLLMAFERHATSKVSEVNDLYAIRTLGFRGEALSAIASVSRVEATSRLHGSLSGYRLKLLGGKIQEVVETGAPEGTTITVRDLFFNTPARRKFLKSRAVETGHLMSVFKRYALAHPRLRWSYTQDGKSLYRLPSESLENRLQALFSAELSDHLIPVEGKDESVTLRGYIGNPKVARRTRSDQFLFVNNRWVQNRLLGFAVASGFGALLENGKFPFYVLYLELPPELVDVNVHPAKSEVKFRREHEIYQLVHKSVREALQKAGIEAFRTYSLSSDEKLDGKTGEITSLKNSDSLKQTSHYTAHNRPGYPMNRRPKPSLEAYQLAFGQHTSDTPEREPASPTERPDEKGDRTNVYQFHQRYIVTEIKGGIAIIDQHAAHERILYEKALRALTGSRMHSQQLLFPKIIELAPDKAIQLREMLDDLQWLGISIREFGERSFVIEALPSGIREGADDQLVLDILEELQEKGAVRRPGQDQIAAAFACRAAVKFGKSLSLAEMNSLIDQLFATRYPFTCPHGRPTLLNLTLTELERRFGRT
jgi:DNA mismatch repair protein MutL